MAELLLTSCPSSGVATPPSLLQSLVPAPRGSHSCTHGPSSRFSWIWQLLGCSEGGKGVCRDRRSWGEKLRDTGTPQNMEERKKERVSP